jgi:hypothetical protein
MHGRFDSEDILGKAYDSRVIGRLPAYLLPVKKWIGIGAIGMVVRTFATLATPYLVGIATNYIVRRHAWLNLAVLALAGTSPGLVRAVFENVNLAYAGQKSSTDTHGDVRHLHLYR